MRVDAFRGSFRQREHDAKSASSQHGVKRGLTIVSSLPTSVGVEAVESRQEGEMTDEVEQLFTVQVDGKTVIVDADDVKIEGSFLVFEQSRGEDPMFPETTRVAIIGAGVRVELVDGAFMNPPRARARSAGF